MVDSPSHRGVVTLRTNRIIGWVAFAVFVGVGSTIIVASLTNGRGPVGFILGGVLIVPGIWAILAMTRPWRFDDQGISRGSRRLMPWPEVTSVHVDDVRPTGAGMGPARVRLRIDGQSQGVDITMYSYRDAADVAWILEQRLPREVSGRESLVRIVDAWQHQR